MHEVKPVKHEDGTETVTLYGTTVDVTSKKVFTLFKRDYKIVRPKGKKKKMDVESSESKTNEEE